MDGLAEKDPKRCSIWDRSWSEKGTWTLIKPSAPATSRSGARIAGWWERVWAATGEARGSAASEGGGSEGVEGERGMASEVGGAEGAEEERAVDGDWLLRLAGEDRCSGRSSGEE